MGLCDVVADEGLEGVVAVLFEAALDEERATPAERGVGDAYDSVDALSVQDAFARAGAVAAEFDTLAHNGCGGHGVLLLLVGCEHARHQAKAKRAVKPMI